MSRVSRGERHEGWQRLEAEATPSRQGARLIFSLKRKRLETLDTRASFSPWSLGRRRWAASTALDAATSSGQAKVRARIFSKTSMLLRAMLSGVVAHI